MIQVFLEQGIPTSFSMDAVLSVIYLGVFATALGLFLQSDDLKYDHPAIAGMILSLESVFGVLCSILIYHKQVILRMLIGFMIIFIAIVLAQWEGKKQKGRSETFIISRR